MYILFHCLLFLSRRQHVMRCSHTRLATQRRLASVCQYVLYDYYECGHVVLLELLSSVLLLRACLYIHVTESATKKHTHTHVFVSERKKENNNDNAHALSVNNGSFRFSTLLRIYSR